jgi:hypothetical protein
MKGSVSCGTTPRSPLEVNLRFRVEEYAKQETTAEEVASKENEGANSSEKSDDFLPTTW